MKTEVFYDVYEIIDTSTYIINKQGPVSYEEARELCATIRASGKKPQVIKRAVTSVEWNIVNTSEEMENARKIIHQKQRRWVNEEYDFKPCKLPKELR